MVLIWVFNPALLVYSIQENQPSPAIINTITIIVTIDAQDFLGAAGDMVAIGETDIELGFMPGTAGFEAIDLGWKIFSIGFWAVKETTAGEAENGLLIGEGEDIGAKASKFIFLGSAGATLGMEGAAGDGPACAGRFAMGWVV